MIFCISSFSKKYFNTTAIGRVIFMLYSHYENLSSSLNGTDTRTNKRFDRRGSYTDIISSTIVEEYLNNLIGAIHTEMYQYRDITFLKYRSVFLSLSI